MLNKVSDGKVIPFVNGLGVPIASGGVGICGNFGVVAVSAVAAAAAGLGETEGVFDLAVVDTVGGGIAVGDVLTVTLATGVVGNTAIGAGVVFFGYALEVVGAGLTVTINVLKKHIG